MSELERRFAFADFVAEMRRRRVVRFALGYCAVAFVVLQLGEIVLPAFGLGDTGLRILVVLVVLGFPPGIALAWIFEFTREGIRRTRGGLEGMLPRVVFLVFTVGTAGGLAGWLWSRGAFTPVAQQEAIVLEAYDPGEPITSIAVLPLEDFSPDASEAYFVAGLQEELTSSLSQLEWLRVASRTSTMQYQGTTSSAPLIGRELGVDALVEGSVTRAGDQVRITLQLIHAASDSHMQTFRFDREMTDVLALQSEVASEVVSGIPGRLEQEEEVALAAASRPSGDPDTQEAYLRGRYQFGLGTPDGYRRAVEYFQQALRNDSGFAPALAGLAGARFLASIEDGFLDTGEAGEASEEARRALALDPGSAEAREVLQFLEGNLPLEIPARGTAIPAPPLSASDSRRVPLAELDTAWATPTTEIGRGLEDAVGRRILQSARTDAGRQIFVARRLAGDGRIDSAIEVLETLLVDHPNTGPAWETLARMHASAGDVAAAVATMRRWTAYGWPEAPGAEAVDRLERAVASGGVAGYWSWQLDRLYALRAEGRRVAPTSLAEASLWAGDPEGALDQLREALETLDSRLMMLRTDPAWDPLRSDPAFAEIAREARRRFAAAGRLPDGRDGRRNPRTR
jgi:TolB-like protein